MTLTTIFDGSAVFAPMAGNQRQILLALDHCVMGATEHANLVTQAAKIGGVAQEDGRGSHGRGG
jgi:hypothetical protein